MKISNRLAGWAISAQPHLHPRVFGVLMKTVWPFVREQDGLVPVCYGPIEMRVDLREDAERHIFMHRYDPSLMAFIRKICREGDRAVDIGANAGALTVTAANAVGPKGVISAIEPNPGLARRMESLAMRNPMGNIEVLACAMGDQEDSLPFYVSSSHPYSSLDPQYLPNYPVKEIVDVAVRTLDGVWKDELRREHVRFLKVDAQGYENRILEGGRQFLNEDRPDCIVVETVTDGLSLVLSWLNEIGYSMFVLNQQGGLDDCDGDMPAEGANLVLMQPRAVLELS